MNTDLIALTGLTGDKNNVIGNQKIKQILYSVLEKNGPPGHGRTLGNFLRLTKKGFTHMKTMVDLGRYFSIFAPSPSGKTTFFREFCRDLESDSTYVPILLSFQFMKNLDVHSFYKRFQAVLYDQLTVMRFMPMESPMRRRGNSF